MELYEIVAIINDVCKKYGIELDAPVQFNGRFSRLLGRVQYHFTNKELRVKSIDFSRKAFQGENKDKEELKQIVLHETAHYIAFKLTGESHSHDEFFRKICAEIGCTMTGEVIDEDNEYAEIRYKYDCTCSKCGRHIRYYKRMPSRLNHKISYCCEAKLNLKQLYWLERGEIIWRLI